MIPDPEGLKELFAARSSCRSFGAGSISDETIRDLLSLACLAPSGQNRQPWAFHVVSGPEPIGMLADIVDEGVARIKSAFTGQNSGLFDRYSEFFTFFRKAPVVIAVFARPYPNLALLLGPADPGAGIPTLDTTHIQSASAAVTQLLLAAEASGLATCWLTNPLIAAREISEALDVSPPWEIMCLVALGNKPADETGMKIPQKKRYPVDRVAKFHYRLELHRSEEPGQNLTNPAGPAPTPDDRPGPCGSEGKSW